MARIAPTPAQKLSYFIFLCISIFILYLDTTSNSLQSIKNSFKSLKISTFYITNKITVEPIRYVINLSKSKNDLIDENINLKDALNISYLNNYLISRENNFFKDEEIIKNAFKKNNYNFSYDIALLRSLDPNIYKCCDKHRMYIEILNNSQNSYKDNVVFNSYGILGLIVDQNKDKYHEVILLTDVSHSLPIKSDSNEFFCNAKGSGRLDIIVCSYNPLLWKEEISIKKEFYTSGLGGIYPKNIKVGFLKEIVIEEPTIVHLEIKLTTNPLEDNLLGVIKY